MRRPQPKEIVIAILSVFAAIGLIDLIVIQKKFKFIPEFPVSISGLVDSGCERRSLL